MKERPRRRRLWLLLALVLGGVATALFFYTRSPQVASGSWLLIPLPGDLPEHNRDALFPGEERPLTLLELRRLLRRAARDSRLCGVAFEVGHRGVAVGATEELTRMVGNLHRAGKKVRVYGHSFDLSTWAFASHSNEISLHPAGKIDLRTPQMMVPFFGPVLERIGVEPDLLRTGGEKDLFEQFTRAGPSDGFAERLRSLHSSFWSGIRALCDRKGKDVQSIEAAASLGTRSALKAMEEQWVDRLEDSLDFEERLREDSQLELVNVATYSRVDDKAGGLEARPSIALLSVEGLLWSGEVENLPFLLGRIQGLAELRRAIENIRATPSIKGVLVRIESPGGEVFASEEAWREIRRLRGRYPVVALLATQATSGGYYAATACDFIYCRPGTLTGSIGVVGGKFVFRQALSKLGVHAFTVGDGERSAPSIWERNGPRARSLAERELEQDFDTFVRRVREGRSLDHRAASAVSGGRVFLGETAHKLGLVDGTGGWAQAWQKICELAEVEHPELASLEVFPRPRGWWERWTSGSSVPALATSSSVWLAELRVFQKFWYLGPLLGWQ